MAAAIQLDPCRDEISGETYLPGRIAGKSSESGGGMDNVLQQLGAVESSVSALRVDVSGITATIPHLATKEDLKKLEGQVSGVAAQIPHLATKEELGAIAAQIPHLATKEELKELKGQIGAIAAQMPHLATKADLSTMETKIIKWIIATVLTASGLTSSIAFTIAKLVH